mmetsp:Transcript_12538/g.21400  ORF Transcript_12538/g.21400 Transcript_12538/m.21400 type:complete len:401 (+) Transcript_12538:123-1325(+)
MTRHPRSMCRIYHATILFTLTSASIFLFLLLIPTTHASNPAQTVDENKSLATIKLELITKLEGDGYLDANQAAEAIVKYIASEDRKIIVQATKHSAWNGYISWINFFKVIAVLFFLVAFSGFISVIISSTWHLLRKIPPFVLQGLGFVICGVGLVVPQWISAKQSFYIAVFCAFGNWMILGWVSRAYPQLARELKKIWAKLKYIPFYSVVGFLVMIYFGVLARRYDSSLFGFFSAVGLSAMFSFSLYYTPGTLYLMMEKEMVDHVIFGHLLALACYIPLYKLMPELTEPFDIGIQYYCTIAMSTGLLIAASPFMGKLSMAIDRALLFVLLFFLAGYGYFFFNLKVISSIILSYFLLFVLEWIAYWGYRGGLISGSILVGVSLYGLAMFMERFSSYIVFRL